MKNLNLICLTISLCTLFLSFSLNAQYSDVKMCQIDNFDSLFEETYQLKDISEHISEQSQSLKQVMPYVERVYLSEQPEFIVLFGSFHAGVNFTALNKDELIDVAIQITKKTELTRNGDIKVLDNDPATLVITSTIHQNNNSLVNVRTMIFPSNHCIIGFNLAVEPSLWAAELRKDFEARLVSFQKNLFTLFGERENINENKFVKFLHVFDDNQTKLDTAASIDYLATDVSITIKSCDGSVNHFNKAKFKKYHSLMKNNTEEFTIDRKIIKLENCDTGTSCTVHSILNEKLIAFNGNFNKTTISSEVAKIDLIEGEMKLKAVNANIACE